MTAAFAADAPSVPEALNAVSPAARLQADHVQTVKQVWGHRKPSLFADRRKVKAQGEATHDAQGMERATRLGPWRWSLLKKPAQVSVAAKPALAALENEAAGCVRGFRTLMRPLGTLCDQAQSAAPAKRRLQPRRRDIHAVDAPPLVKRRRFLDDHGEQALRYLRNKGRGKPRRGSHSASGMRLRRWLEKNHDGLRSAATRQ
jgi:hypothetical protein